MGRVTLNPIPHIDPIGTLLFPLMMMFTGIPLLGWAKPVPVNPLNLRNPRRDNLWISFAGPLSNFTAAVGFIVLLRIIKALNPQAFYIASGFSGGFSPIQALILMLYYGALINTFLAVFNLIPIPPLDGSGVLLGLLSAEAAEKYDRIRPYGFFIIIGLFLIGFLQMVFMPIRHMIDLFVFS
jgi:Zn-dependent protease